MLANGTVVHPGDDPRFLEVIQVALDAELRAQTVREVFLVRIDNWFDDKWPGFAAKFFFGAVTVVPNRTSGDFGGLPFPPFTPRRVLTEHHFVQGDSGQFALAEEARLIHDLRRSRGL